MRENVIFKKIYREVSAFIQVFSPLKQFETRDFLRSALRFQATRHQIFIFL